MKAFDFVAERKDSASERTQERSGIVELESMGLPLTLPTLLHSKRTYFYRHLPHKPSQKNTRIWRIPATSGDVLPSDAPIETAQRIVSSDDSGVFTVISVLLFIAFFGLSILTIGVIYIGVSDFLQKRERERSLRKKRPLRRRKKVGKEFRSGLRQGPEDLDKKLMTAMILMIKFALYPMCQERGKCASSSVSFRRPEWASYQLLQSSILLAGGSEVWSISRKSSPSPPNDGFYSLSFVALFLSVFSFSVSLAVCFVCFVLFVWVFQ
ncbi:PREDICTED: uncharacterized protein LOC104601068 [Nelumbo nucifera]|uniref:Uncharacterized protein LOC104601068 n=1 Tax=Nelumbo nucifera TaxID=4432 RepID=A0A1U8Q554_NELNU|nr:PREDICTED: uncharacterized protein LOC104601068 [Nelumbo nucifera]